jgi:hypothetical protein
MPLTKPVNDAYKKDAFGSFRVPYGAIISSYAFLAKIELTSMVKDSIPSLTVLVNSI